jgi:hypothetical protein
MLEENYSLLRKDNFYLTDAALLGKATFAAIRRGQCQQQNVFPELLVPLE